MTHMFWLIRPLPFVALFLLTGLFVVSYSYLALASGSPAVGRLGLCFHQDPPIPPIPPPRFRPSATLWGDSVYSDCFVWKSLRVL